MQGKVAGLDNLKQPDIGESYVFPPFLAYIVIEREQIHPRKGQYTLDRHVRALRHCVLREKCCWLATAKRDSCYVQTVLDRLLVFPVIRRPPGGGVALA